MLRAALAKAQAVTPAVAVEARLVTDQGKGGGPVDYHVSDEHKQFCLELKVLRFYFNIFKPFTQTNGENVFFFVYQK